MLQTVAIMGPARFGVPLTQALTAPLLGRLEGRRASLLRQILACGAIRFVHTTLTVAFFALVLAGGIDVFTESYDSIASHLPLLPEGTRAALIVAGAGLVAWAVFASTVQVLVYRRGLRHWPAGAGAQAEHGAPDSADLARRRFDPRAICLAAAIAFCLLLASTAWLLLAAVFAWLLLASISSGGDRDVVPVGVGIAVLLAGGVLAFALVGGLGYGLALQRALRAALLVLVATWLRAAAGAAGLREVSRRALGRLRRVPAMREASLVLEDLGSGRELAGAARSALDVLSSVPKRPLPLLDALLGWVAAESARFRAAPASAPARLAFGPGDGMLVVLAALPLLVLAAT